MDSRPREQERAVEGEPLTSKLIRIDVTSGKRLSAVPFTLPPGYRVHHSHERSPGRAHTGDRGPVNLSDILMIERFATPATGWKRLFGHWVAPGVHP